MTPCAGMRRAGCVRSARDRVTRECLVADGHEVFVIAPGGSVDECAGAAVLRVPDPRILWRLFRYCPDVVRVVGPVCLGLGALLAARLLFTPRGSRSVGAHLLG